MTTTFESIVRLDTQEAYITEYSKLTEDEKAIFDETCLYNKDMHSDCRWEMPFAFKNECLGATSGPWLSAIFNLQMLNN